MKEHQQLIDDQKRYRANLLQAKAVAINEQLRQHSETRRAIEEQRLQALKTQQLKEEQKVQQVMLSKSMSH